MRLKGAVLQEEGGGRWEGLKGVTCVILHGVLWSSGSRGRGGDPTLLAGLLTARTSFCTQEQEVPVYGRSQRYLLSTEHQRPCSRLHLG